MLHKKEECKEVVHVLGFVHVPRSPPLALGVFVARHSLAVDLLALPLPPQVLLLLLFRRRHVQVQAGLREGEILSGNTKQIVVYIWAPAEIYESAGCTGQ